MGIFTGHVGIFTGQMPMSPNQQLKHSWLTQPSIRRRMVKWVSARNNNKWKWRMWVLAAAYQVDLRPSLVGLVQGF